MKINTVFLSILSIGGVIGTSYLVADATCKNSDILKDKNLSKKEKIKRCWKNYIPAAGAGLATIASITTGTIISKKTEASLAASAMIAKKAYDKYQGKVKEVLGIEDHKKVMTEIAKDEAKEIVFPKSNKPLYFNEYIGYFRAHPCDVQRAIKNMNMHIASTNSLDIYKCDMHGWCTFEQFVHDAHADILDKEKYEKIKTWGWTTVYLNDEADDCWIYDFETINAPGNNECSETLTVLELLGAEPIPDAQFSIEVYKDRYYELERAKQEALGADYEVVESN